MKKMWFFSFLFFCFLFVSCDQESEEIMLECGLAEQVEKAADNLRLQTRSDVLGRKTLYVNKGDKVGFFVKYGAKIEGPEYYTIDNISGIGNENLTFQEATRFKDPNLPHTFYAYYPFEGSVSSDPTKVEVRALSRVQTQHGASQAHLKDVEFYVADPVVVNPGKDLKINLFSIYSTLEFEINSNINGLKVNRIDLKTPNNEVVAFSAGTVDITKSIVQQGFSEIKNIKEGSDNIRLNIVGGIDIPNSTTSHASAYMEITPFDGKLKDMRVTAYTNQGEFEFFIKSDLYEAGFKYLVKLRIEKKSLIKDIRVLSLCEVGYLGRYDNSQKWNCYYGVDCFANYSMNMRRILFEHFGKGKTVETGIISFDKTDISCYLNKMTDSQLDKYDIIFMNKNARPDKEMSQRVMNWLNRSPKRVLMLAYDWKEPCLTSKINENQAHKKTATNYLIFKNHIKGVKPHWYNGCAVNRAEGNYGVSRSCMFVPFELNSRTSYFWKDGPFKTTLSNNSEQFYWIKDCCWGSADVTDPNVIPLVTYRDARNDCYPSKTHKCGKGDNGMVLGVDPTKRIVYVGDSELFSMAPTGCCTSNAKKETRIAFDRYGNLNDYGRIMGNLWAWMITEIIQKP